MERGDDRPTVVDAFRAGDERALAEVYAHWSPLVHTLALRSLHDVSDAEAVTQRVFVQAWSARDTFDPARVRLPAWLLVITRDKIADVHESRRGQAGLGARRSAGAEREDATGAADLAGRLVLADEMSRLEAVPRQVLRMAFQDDATSVQIAERMGLSSGAVRGHLRQSLLRLRERLEVLADAR